MENIPVTETGKEAIMRRNIIRPHAAIHDKPKYSIAGGNCNNGRGGGNDIYHKPNHGSESNKCPDSDVCPRVDVGESWKTGTETIPRDVLGLDLVSHTKVGEDQEWNTAQHTHRMPAPPEPPKPASRPRGPPKPAPREPPKPAPRPREPCVKMANKLHHEPNYGSKRDKCPVVVLHMANVLYHEPDYGSESESDEFEPDPEVCPRVDIGESWKNGLFDCHKNKTIAAVVTFCPCVAFGHIAEVLDEGETTCPMGSFIYLLMMPLLCSQWIIGSKYRKKLRHKLNLAEAPYEDWASHLFCHCCSLCQEYKELQIRGLDPSLGWKGILARQQGMQQRSQDLVQCPPLTQAMSK